MFVQIHILQSLPPGNVNRDDTGQPKKCTFGGVTRGRISSQCLKRNIRLSKMFESTFGEKLAKRTKFLPTLVGEELKDMKGFPADDIEGVMKGVAGLFKKESKTEGDSKDEDTGITPQLVFIPPPFAKKIAQLVSELREKSSKAYEQFIGKAKKGKKDDADVKKDIDAFVAEAFEARESLSIDVGLFGRMTTSNLVKDVEAACQVAHAISTHEALVQGDYFTAMDDAQNDYLTTQLDKKGAAFLGSGDTVTFFNSAVYYKYLNVDVDALLETLGHEHAEQAVKAVGMLIKAAALATPTGKQNSFAAHSAPELILVEVSGTKQPISLANAFLEPVTGNNLMASSVEALVDYHNDFAVAYETGDTQRYVLAVGKSSKEAASKINDAQDVKNIDALVDSVQDSVSVAEAS